MIFMKLQSKVVWQSQNSLFLSILTAARGRTGDLFDAVVCVLSVGRYCTHSSPPAFTTMNLYLQVWQQQLGREQLFQSVN